MEFNKIKMLTHAVYISNLCPEAQKNKLRKWNTCDLISFFLFIPKAYMIPSIVNFKN